jgi:hypothetical protein
VEEKGNGEGKWNDIYLEILRTVLNIILTSQGVPFFKCAKNFDFGPQATQSLPDVPAEKSIQVKYLYIRNSAPRDEGRCWTVMHCENECSAWSLGRTETLGSRSCRGASTAVSTGRKQVSCWRLLTMPLCPVVCSA